jgi:hypothetical protein
VFKIQRCKSVYNISNVDLWNRSYRLFIQISSKRKIETKRSSKLHNMEGSYSETRELKRDKMHLQMPLCTRTPTPLMIPKTIRDEIGMMPLKNNRIRKWNI